jgi:hypothetical protein
VSADTSRVQWGPLICDYYPASRRFAWHLKGRGRDITKALTKPAVISLINIELEARA